MKLAELQRRLTDFGLNLSAPLALADYDSLVPEAWRAERIAAGCRGALIVGNAGRALWPLFAASPEASLRRNPLDRYTARVLADVSGLAGPATRFTTYTERRDDTYLPLVRLAERAGFGVPGRVGVLLHPVYGPWISIRGVLYLQEELASPTLEVFDPCTGCPAPCALACHGGVVGSDGVDSVGCFRTKLLQPACRAACDARSACIVGPEHAFSAEQIAHHSRIRWRPSTVRHAVRVLVRGKH